MASPAALITEMESWEHLKNLTKMVGPYIVLLIGLLIYTWKQHEKSQDKLEQTLTEHILADDRVHDELFKQSRAQGEDVRELKTDSTSQKATNVTHNQMFKSVAADMDELREDMSEFKIDCAKQHGGDK